MGQKTLKDFLEVYKPKSPDEQKFVDKHVTIKFKDRNGNKDDVFNATNIKTIKRKEGRHGYDAGEDEKVYESLEELELETVLDEALDLLNSIDEKTLTPNELKKREQIVKAVKRSDPKMDKSTAYAIATDTAKRVAEESEELDELSRETVRSYYNKGGKEASKIYQKFMAHGGDWGDGSDTKTLKKRTAGRVMALKRREGKVKMSEESEQIVENDLKTQIIKPSYDGNAVSDHKKNLDAAYKKLGRGEIKKINSLHHTFNNPYGETKVLTTPHGTHITHTIKTKMAEESEQEDADYKKNKEETKKTFPNVKHFTAKGHPDWKKHPESQVKESVEHDTQTHKIETDRMGHYTITHKPSNTSVYLQGDDARDFDNELSKTKGNQQKVDRLASDYHHVMEALQPWMDGSDTPAYLRKANYRDELIKRRKDKVDAQQDVKGGGPALRSVKNEAFEVVDNEFNRANYKHLIGKRYSDEKVPSYARVKKVEEKPTNSTVKNEEVESIDEVSNQTKISYLNKVYDKVRSTNPRQPIPDKRMKYVKKAQEDLNAHWDKQKKDNDAADVQKVLDRTPKVHDLRHMSHGEVYDHTQTSDKVHDGDVLHVKGGAAIMYKAWPTMVHGDSKTLHSWDTGHSWNDKDVSHYKRAVDIAKSLNEEMSPQEAYRRKHGHYNSAWKAPTPDEAIGHAMNTITAKYGKPKEDECECRSCMSKRAGGSVKEEALDELSKKTLRSYRGTATKNLEYHDTAWNNIADHGEMKFTKSQEAGFKKHDDEARKRYAGIKMATRKLNKEDVLNRAYDKYVPEEVKYTPRELFLNRLEGLSESHSNTLMDLFESLSKENQTKMTQDAKTTEGLNKLLNFAIENRGE